MYYILKHSGMEFKKEFVYPNNKWRYDFYIPKHNAIIEIHGGQHYYQTTYGNLEENQKNDKAKIDFALSNGIKNYIVIDASNSRFDYIINSIINSDLSNIYDLNFVDWDEIKNALFSKSLVKDVCDYWNLHKDATYVDMEKIFSLSESTIRKYLQIGYKLDWCFKDERNKKRKHAKQKKIKGIYERKFPLLNSSVDCTNNSTPIVYIPNNIYFKSSRLCTDNSERLIGKRIPTSTIRYKLARNHPDFKYVTKEEFNNAYYNGETCCGTPFDEEIL